MFLGKFGLHYYSPEFGRTRYPYWLHSKGGVFQCPFFLVSILGKKSLCKWLEHLSVDLNLDGWKNQDTTPSPLPSFKESWVSFNWNRWVASWGWKITLWAFQHVPKISSPNISIEIWGVVLEASVETSRGISNNQKHQRVSTHHHWSIDVMLTGVWFFCVMKLWFLIP